MRAIDHGLVGIEVFVAIGMDPYSFGKSIGIPCR